MSFQNMLNKYGKLYSYDNIPLRLFIEIASTGNVKLLLIKGYATDDKLLEKWEQLVKKNSEANQSFQYSETFTLIQSYNVMLNQYSIIKAMLMKLSLEVDPAYIKELKVLGYSVSTVNDDKYAVSIETAMHKSNHMVTKLKMKLSEIENLQEDKTKEPQSVEELIASLSMMLGFEVKDDITLARYNQYQIMLKKKAKSQKDGIRNK